MTPWPPLRPPAATPPGPASTTSSGTPPGSPPPPRSWPPRTTPSPRCASSSPGPKRPWTVNAPSSTRPSACCTTSSPAGQPPPLSAASSPRSPPQIRTGHRRPQRQQPPSGATTITAAPPATPDHDHNPVKGQLMTLTDPVSPELKQLLRTLKLGKMLDTLPERLALARQQQLPHADFLELLLADEVTRRETNSAARRARAAGLDPDMRLDTWDTTAAVRYDQQLWNELCQPPIRRRRPRRPDAGSGRRRQDPPGHRAGPHRRAPPAHRPHGPRRPDVQALKPPGWTTPSKPRCAASPAVDVLIIDDFALQPWTRPRPATSTNWSSKGTASEHHRHLQPGPPTNGSPSWPTRCSPSPPSTGSPPPPRTHHRRRVLPPPATPRPTPT